MAILAVLKKSQFEVSLESTDRELIYPSSFVTSSGFDIELKGNYSVFNPIEITTSYDHEYFEDLIGYLLDISASRVLDNSFKEKLFDLVIYTKNCTGHRYYGYSYCAHDCHLTNVKFLEVNRYFTDGGEETDGHEVVGLSLTLLPRYISRFIPDNETEEKVG
jgi:hypothetical protein